ncbi:putative ABC transporter permease [Clostridium arbusti]|uniref:putative ABC transporter permease n=1 Tax=Clostridium arbusti TaxID=1137848 RepID=UPI00028875EF|nr:putative ABC transporter permease [Clostridium arbusti]
MLFSFLQPIDFYHLFFYFLFYSFLGWCVEVCYSAITKGELINRGFLNGPFCPVYGFGAVLLIVIIKPFQNHTIFLIIGCLFLPSFIEYITGFILEKLFDTTWWDYSDTKFNLKGRICVKFSILWFLVSLFIILFIQPYIIDYIINLLPIKHGFIIMYILLVYFFIDLYITIISLIKLKGLFTELNHISSELKIKLNTIIQIGASINYLDVSSAPRNIKNKVTDAFQNTTKNINNKIEDINYKFENTTYNIASKLSGKLSNDEEDIFNTVTKKIRELKNTYDGILNKIDVNYSRIFKAYPHLKSKYSNKTLIDIKEKIKQLNVKIKDKK